MRSAWSEEEANAAVSRYVAAGTGRCNEDLALRTYSARLIGAESGLVLHGGGNTSVKTRMRDDTGETVDVICVKGSGWDLGAIEPAGHPAVRLESLRALRSLEALSDEDMVNAARTRLLDASAPNPSVELLLHAFLPHKFIDHSHADAILALADQEDAQAICERVFGASLGFVPYVMPGFCLAKLAAEVYERDPSVEGLVLHQHGLFTFGATARESYERHVSAVSAAEQHIQAAAASAGRGTEAQVAENGEPEIAWDDLGPTLRGRMGSGERRYTLVVRSSAAIRVFVDDPSVEKMSRRGPATPDHVIRTKQRPLLLDRRSDETWEACIDRVLDAYRSEYRDYFSRQVAAKKVERVALDADPRIILVPGLGLVAAGKDERAANVAADIYEHTIGVIRAADAVGSYRALPESDIFDMEYWSLEQAKLGRAKPRPLDSQVVIVSGAARGIGAAVARAFSEAGAQLWLLDRDPAVADVAKELGSGHSVTDVGDIEQVEAAVRRVVARFGGLDGVVSNAGVAPQSPMHECPPEVLEESFAVNLFGHQWLAAAASRVMRAQGSGGYLLFNASKAAMNPGRDFGPYAVAKAALVALMRQYALEGAEAGIRANAVNADRVRTGLLDAEDVERRAKARGLDTDAYFKSNLLGREVSCEDVASAFLHLALAKSTTAAVLAVDGGNLAAAPR